MALAALAEFVTPAAAADVQAARTLAKAVDDNPGQASLWREYREALAVLRGLVVTEERDEFADVLAALRNPETAGA